MPKTARTLISVLMFLLLFSCAEKKQVKHYETNSGKVKFVCNEADSIGLEYDETDRLVHFLYFSKLDKTSVTDLQIEYVQDTVIMKGRLAKGNVIQKYEIDSLGNAVSCFSKWTGADYSAEESITIFDYNPEGFLINTSTNYYYGKQFLRKRGTKFIVRNNNVVDIHDDLSGSKSTIQYGIDKNLAGVRTLSQIWNNELYLAGLYAGILGRESENLPIRAMVSSSEDPRVKYDYVYSGYVFDDFGFVKGWNAERYFSESRETDTQTFKVGYFE